MNRQKTRNEILSENIQGYLTQSNLTQKEAAERAGLNSTTLNNWIRCHSYPNERYLKRLANVFGCSYADLTTEHTDIRSGYLTHTEQQILTIYRGNEPFRRVVNLAMDAYHRGDLIRFAEILSEKENP